MESTLDLTILSPFGNLSCLCVHVKSWFLRFGNHSILPVDRSSHPKACTFWSNFSLVSIYYSHLFSRRHSSRGSLKNMERYEASLPSETTGKKRKLVETRGYYVCCTSFFCQIAHQEVQFEARKGKTTSYTRSEPCSVSSKIAAFEFTKVTYYDYRIRSY
jgi:hypothetical protein